MSVTGGIIAGVGAASSIAGGAIASSGAQSAAGAQAGASEQAAQLQYQSEQQALQQQQLQYGNELNLLGPGYMQGQGALANLSNLLGIPVNGNVVNPTSLPTGLNGQPAGSQLGAPGGYQSYANNSQALRFNGGRAPYTGTAAMGGQFGAQGSTVPLSSLINPSLGAPGSLSQGWTGQFQAPTGLTEQNDPGYQARLQLGETALQNSAAARGGLITGGTAAGLNQYAQDYASNEYGNVYNRAYNQYATQYNTFQQNQANLYNRLASAAGLGQTTAGQLANLSGNQAGQASNTLLTGAGQIGNSLQNAGAARASGYAGSTNALTGTIGSLGSLASLLALGNSSSPYSTSSLANYPIPEGPTSLG